MVAAIVERGATLSLAITLETFPIASGHTTVTSIG
jgi:hypothetical protein